MPRCYPLHPACQLFPQLHDEELRDLADDIRRNGLQNAIVLLDGRILDGRNRYLACRLAKVEPRFKEWDGEGSPAEWVLSQNLIRRHLSSSQRAVVAHDLLPILVKEAKERQRLSRGRGKKGRNNFCTFSEGGEATEVAARIAKSNARYVKIVRTIAVSAPDVVAKIRAGDLSVTDAEWIAKLPMSQRRKLFQGGLSEDALRHWKYRPKKNGRAVAKVDRRARIAATRLIHGDCRDELRKIPSKSIDAIITDPIYPEVNREYGRISEQEWHRLMKDVVTECRRVLRPKGSIVIVLQANYAKVGQMRLWPWRFLLSAAEQWNLIQDVYWWACDALPTAGTNRNQGLLRQSVKMCVWLGPADCYRSQDNVLWVPSERHSARKWSDRALQHRPSGHTVRDGRTAQSSAERGGTTPFNLLPIPNLNETSKHPATTPYQLAEWWCKYILPPRGVLLDPFCGSGTMLAAGLDCGASKVIGIDREKKYIAMAKRRVLQSH